MTTWNYTYSRSSILQNTPSAGSLVCKLQVVAWLVGKGFSSKKPAVKELLLNKGHNPGMTSITSPRSNEQQEVLRINKTIGLRGTWKEHEEFVKRVNNDCKGQGFLYSGSLLGHTDCALIVLLLHNLLLWGTRGLILLWEPGSSWEQKLVWQCGSEVWKQSNRTPSVHWSHSLQRALFSAVKTLDGVTLTPGVTSEWSYQKMALTIRICLQCQYLNAHFEQNSTKISSANKEGCSAGFYIH